MLKPTRLMAAAGTRQSPHRPSRKRHVAVLGHRTCIACGRAGHVARRMICLTAVSPRRDVKRTSEFRQPLDPGSCRHHRACCFAHSVYTTGAYKSLGPRASCSAPTSHAIAGNDTRAGVLVGGCRRRAVGARGRRACARQSRVGWLWSAECRPGRGKGVQRLGEGWSSIQRS
jgi:hypothetical protein